jgi:hypothetical protein
MTAAFDERSEQQKQAAILRTLADQVASPVVAGRKSRKALTPKQRREWSGIVDVVSRDASIGPLTLLEPKTLAGIWRDDCKAIGIGTGLLSWFLWNWAFPLLVELAKRWIESQRLNESRVSDR